MANYLTIDGGTTNTRINLVLNGIVVDSVKLSMGVRLNIDGNETYKKEIKNSIYKLLADNDIEEKILKEFCAQV